MVAVYPRKKRTNINSCRVDITPPRTSDATSLQWQVISWSEKWKVWSFIAKCKKVFYWKINNAWRFKIMSSRGTSRGLSHTAHGNIGDITILLVSSTLVCDVGISRKRPHEQGWFPADCHIVTMTAAQLKTLLEASIHCLFTNKLLIATLHYDAFDLEGWAVGVAVMVTITIVQASRWETFQNNEIVRKVTPILQWRFPADCHVSRKSRLPRNDTLITYYH